MILTKLAKLSSVFICFSILFHINAKANELGGFINIKKAYEQQLIDLEMTSLGCYNGNCLQLVITNKTDKTLLIELDAGQLLEPFDPKFQSFLMKNRQKIALPEGVSKELNIEVFSANMKKQTPTIGAFFAFPDSTPTFWHQVCNYLTINDYEKKIAQKAVWFITNDFPYSAVCSENKKETAKIRLYLQSLKPNENAAVNIYYKTDSMGVPVKVFDMMTFDLPYHIRNNTMLSAYVSNDRGQPVKRLKQGIPRNPGSYTYEAKFSIAGWPPGDYFIVLRTQDQLLLKKSVKLSYF